MEYYFEIYLNARELTKIGLTEELIEWSGEKLSQDPRVFVSDSGLRFEEITYTNRDLVDAGVELMSGSIGLNLKGYSFYELSRKLRNREDTSRDPWIRFIDGLNALDSFVIILCRVDESIKRKITVNGGEDLKCAVSEALDWDDPRDIVFVKG